MAKTRSSAEVWLLVTGTYQLSGSHLQTNRVSLALSLQLSMFLHNEQQ